MPLKLVTGPANSAKAGEVLGALRDRLDEDPILVVPAFEDVEHNQRELAERGAVFGARVVRFAWLFEIVAERVGYAGRLASEVQRELVVEEALRRTQLRALAESAAQPGFVRAAARFVAELGRSMVDPARLTRALREWAAGGERARYAEEVAAIYEAYRDGLVTAGLVDRELFAWRALDALRRDPVRWRRTPLFVYGFDDFTPLELDALETIARHAKAEVTVSLPYEPGRVAFKAVASVERRLAEMADERTVLPPLSDHYAEGSREPLHHLERHLFELDGPSGTSPGGAVRLHSAGGERAEVELVGAEVLRLLRAGTTPGDVAVVFREPGRYASVVEQVFEAYEIPFSIERSVPLSHTGLGRGLLALVRCAALDGTAEDLLAYLRTPGRLEEPALADRLEAAVRREGARSAAEARSIWERERWPLDELDRLRESRAAAAFLEELDHELARLFEGPYRRRAPLLAGSELDDARVFVAAHQAIADLRALVAAGVGADLDLRRLHDVLAGLPVRTGEDPQPDRVQIAHPEAVRARRFEAVFVCGLQEGEFPGAGTPEPFLPDQDRREIATASGLLLPAGEDQLERERYLFYVCASRAERLLVLSSRYCDEEGNPEARSFFLDDVCDLFGGLESAVRRRSLSQVSFPPEEAPTAAEWARAVALLGPRRAERRPHPLTAPEVLSELAAREAVSAGALERFADCPVKWLVEDLLRPSALEPDPEQMVRGRYAHKVLEQTYRKLRERTGRRRVTPDNLPDAERILLSELRERRTDFRLSPDQTRVRAAMRRLEFDLLRYLRHEARSDGLFEPEHLELRFGADGEPPVELADGMRVRGMIDRVDTWDGYALVRDYKSGKRVDRYKVASWERENRFQAALYMLVVRELLGLRPAGGVYVPLGGDDRRPRGLLAAELPQLGSDFVHTDRLGPEELEEKLEWALETVVATAGRMRRGDLCCNPESCAFDGGCSYPSVCRSEA